MSADNFNYIQKRGDNWLVWLNLSASCDKASQIARPPDRVFGEGERAEAVRWANDAGYTEYGTEVDEAEPLAARSVGGLVAWALKIVADSNIEHDSKMELVDILGELALRLRQADRLNPREP